VTAVFDANVLLLLLDPLLPPPKDPATGSLVTDANQRITYLVNELQRQHRKIVIPTPALSEVLVRAGAAGDDYLTRLSRAAAFKIEPFDVRCAVEVAAMTAAAIAAGDKKSGSAEPWAKVKYDRQIVATARVVQASIIYTDDGGIRTFAGLIGMSTSGIAGLPLPPQDAQLVLPWNAPQDEAHPNA
jgi:hypothetical protein